MFGYVVPSWEGLDDAERERYHAAYCGLCRAIGQRCGQRCRVALTYDLVFFALLLGSLYEPEERAGEGRCVPHPVKPHGFVSTACIDYAADVTVALAYYKALDDWNDDRSVRARAFAGALLSVVFGSISGSLRHTFVKPPYPKSSVPASRAKEFFAVALSSCCEMANATPLARASTQAAAMTAVTKRRVR